MSLGDIPVVVTSGSTVVYFIIIVNYVEKLQKIKLDSTSTN